MLTYITTNNPAHVHVVQTGQLLLVTRI